MLCQITPKFIVGTPISPTKFNCILPTSHYSTIHTFQIRNFTCSSPLGFLNTKVVDLQSFLYISCIRNFSIENSPIYCIIWICWNHCINVLVPTGMHYFLTLLFRCPKIVPTLFLLWHTNVNKNDPQSLFTIWNAKSTYLIFQFRSFLIIILLNLLAFMCST